MTNLIATEPTINGKCFCENDESKIINNNNEVRLMLGIYDRSTNEVRIFYIDNNRTKENLFPIKKILLHIIKIYIII